MPDSDSSSANISSPRLRKLAIHEAAHAAMQWNLGIGVQRVWIDRIRDCGHSQGLRHGTDRSARVSHAVVCVAGLAAQCFVEAEMRWEDVVRSFTDLHRALVDFLPPGELSDGEQLAVALALTSRVEAIMKGAELKRQVYALIPPLLKDGCMLQRQVDSALKALPDSAAAQRQSRELVAELIHEREGIVASIRGYAREFRWNPTTA